jgi:hypothetical protein
MRWSTTLRAMPVRTAYWMGKASVSRKVVLIVRREAQPVFQIERASCRLMAETPAIISSAASEGMGTTSTRGPSNRTMSRTHRPIMTDEALVLPPDCTFSADWPTEAPTGCP